MLQTILQDNSLLCANEYSTIVEILKEKVKEYRYSDGYQRALAFALPTVELIIDTGDMYSGLEQIVIVYSLLGPTKNIYDRVINMILYGELTVLLEIEKVILESNYFNTLKAVNKYVTRITNDSLNLVFQNKKDKYVYVTNNVVFDGIVDKYDIDFYYYFNLNYGSKILESQCNLLANAVRNNAVTFSNGIYLTCVHYIEGVASLSFTDYSNIASVANLVAAKYPNEIVHFDTNARKEYEVKYTNFFIQEFKHYIVGKNIALSNVAICNNRKMYLQHKKAGYDRKMLDSVYVFRD